MQDKRLHYFVAVRHMRDHVSHIVLRGPDKSGTKHQSQVSGLHLEIMSELRSHLSPLRTRDTSLLTVNVLVPYFFQSDLQLSSGGPPGTLGCDNNDLVGH